MKPTKKILIKRALLMSISFLMIVFMGVAQNYRVSGTPKIMITGTSTIHDWEMTSNQADLKAAFETDAAGIPTKLASLNLSIPAESLKSGKGAMDKNAYTSLKTDKNKLITFQLTSATINGKTIDTKGNLTIAGTTKPIEINTTFETQGDGSLKFKGSKKIIMSEFNVEPPSFMFGSVKTGDEITLSFEIIMSPNKL